ncbi:MAG: DHA2 family efflux MFS transporter permease subunit, partial [Rhodomicrobium sp.]
MSANAEALPAATAPAAGTANPWLIAVVVALAVFMEVLDTTIANVALPYIAGGLGVSQDEASWVVTTYLVANAIIITATGFLPQRFGRKPFFLFSLGLFTLSSVLCGMAWNLQSLLLFRVLQGIGGGGMVPVAQSILADSFPPQKRGQAFALFGVAVVVAPVIGPTLGGWIADNYSWQWNFLINGPIGLGAMALVFVLVHEGAPANKDVRFDLIGFLLVATFLGSLEVVLDRGLVEDWFESNFIIIFSIICALAFVALIPWEAAQKNPTADVRMIATRQFGSAFVVMLSTGSILYATTQFM